MASCRTFRPSLALVVLISLALAPRPAGAAGFGLFQHGGRGVAQVGALTGRADDPSAVTYNPAGITRVKGLQFQAGLDFAMPEDDFRHVTGGFFSATHDTNLSPALYLTWSPEESPWAVGLGLDAPFWTTTEWRPTSFTGANRTRKLSLELLELHPVLAYAVNERWSVGLGVRYLRGEIEDAHRVLLASFGLRNSPTVLGEHTSEADVNGWGYDAALRYERSQWGWGAVVRSAAKVDGASRNIVEIGPISFPLQQEAAEEAARFLAAHPEQLSFEQPPEMRVGFWGAPRPELRIELDLAYAAWSEVDNTLERIFAPRLCEFSSCVLVIDRQWEDTLSVRLGVEGQIAENASLSGGIAYEPSPVQSSQFDPGFPRGDALVYALGWTYDLSRVSFDLGYSFHDHDARGDHNFRFSASEQVFAFAVRWR